jgi:hypothetical protein
MALLVAGCNSNDKRSERIEQMIAHSKLASDPHTWSLPNEARVTRLHWDAEVDMKAHVIQAVATYKVRNLTKTNEVIFDMKGLNVSEVRVNNQLTTYTIGESRPYIGELELFGLVVGNLIIRDSLLLDVECVVLDGIGVFVAAQVAILADAHGMKLQACGCHYGKGPIHAESDDGQQPTL